MMSNRLHIPFVFLVSCVLFCTAMTITGAYGEAPPWAEQSAKTIVGELVAQYGDGQRVRVERGVEQVLSFWNEQDGDASTFEDFVRANFAGDDGTLDATFVRFEDLLERLDGHMNEIVVAFRRQSDLDIGTILPFDEAFAGYDPSAHVLDDLFANKLAFVVLLNFPLTTLQERLNDGDKWTRREWAEARLAQRFSKRIPADVNLAIAKASAFADQYIAEYNIWMHHLVGDSGERMFPPKMRLLSHWNLRDEIKAQYSRGEEALSKQRTIQRVMERIVTQTIPEVVIDNPHVDWNPYSNEVARALVNDAGQPPPADLKISDAREPDTRYAVLLETFRASRGVDPYSPTAPTLIARRFDENREIPEERVESMFKACLSSPH
ncbi:MAG: hypothetical protein OEN01_10565, partial [Candidatus Krumholzibacteria bacterium]|nr:hypothetical protein [Candidatus Krumholzibacteria bacterium]